MQWNCHVYFKRNHACTEASEGSEEHTKIIPILIGHEFAGVIEQVGEKWKDQYRPGDKYVVLEIPGIHCFPVIPMSISEGGHCCIVPGEVIQKGCRYF